MTTIADKLQLTLSTKNAIKQALIDKGADVGDVPFASYPALIGGLFPIGTGTQGQIVTPDGAGGLIYDDITIAYVQGLQEALNAKRALTNTSFPRYDLASVSQTGTGTITLDLAQAQSFRHAVTGTTTFEFSNAQGADKSQPVALYLYDSSLGARVINYPSGVSFGDQAPDFTDKVWALVLFFWSGNEWVGSVGAQG